jgi:hypothetical protein
VCVVSRAGRGGAGSEYLMLRRAEDGLLAGMWEFPSVICSSTSTSSAAPSLHRRQQLLDSLLASALPAASLASCSERRSVGSLVHVFSHRRHLMQVEGRKGRQREREQAWLTEEGMLTVGLTTGQRKVLQLLKTAGKRDAAAGHGRGRTISAAEDKEEAGVGEDEEVDAAEEGDQEEQEEWEVWPAAAPAPLCDREVILID